MSNLNDYYVLSGLPTDGTSDCTAMIQSALDTYKQVILPYNSAGYKVGTITLYSGYSLTGAGRYAKITPSAISGNVFVISGSNVICSNLEIDCPAGHTGTVFRLATSLSSMEYVTIYDVRIKNCYSMIGDDNHISNIHVKTRIENVYGTATKGPGIVFRNAYAFLEIFNVAVDRVGVASAYSVGFEIDNCQGGTLANCDVTGSLGTDSSATVAQKGFLFNNCAAIFLDKCMADTCGGNGFEFQAVSYIYLSRCVSSLVNGYGFYLNGCTFVTANNIVAAGRVGLGGAAAAQHGILLNSVQNASFATVHSRNNTGDGVNVGGSSQVISVTDLISTSNTGYGYRNASAGSAKLCSSTTVYNGAGNVSISNSLQAIFSHQVGSGAFINGQVGAYSV